MKRTVIAPTNIAFVKYWGKNPTYERYHIPNKSSASFTVEGLYTITTIEAKSGGEGKATFVLNGKEIKEGEKEGKYVFEFLAKIKERYPFIANYDYNVVSENNFPTAAGYASSASGFAAFARALVEVVPEFERIRENDREISILARLGSGSATRSIPRKGGLVVWRRGVDPKENGLSPDEAIEKSYAETLIPPEELEELRIVYTYVERKEKKVKSRAGMKTSVQTCPIYWEWVSYDEHVLLPRALEAVKQKNWSEFFKLTMIASNGLHAVCHYTYPPIFYLNDVSKEIISAIHAFNEGGVRAAYTFDAGPNAVVFTTSNYVDEIKSLLEEIVGEGNLFITKPGPGPELV